MERKQLLSPSIVFVILTWLVYLVNLSPSAAQLAEMEEVDVLVGDLITLNCTLLRPHPAINSSIMYFKFGNTRVDSKYVTRPDPLTIQLNVTATLHMKGHIFCHAENYTETLAHQVVEVHNHPITPYNLSCVVKDWRSMECSWEPSAQEQKDHTNLTTNQTLYWVLLPKYHPDETGFWCPYSNADQNQCLFKIADGANSFRPDMDYELEVVAANILGEASASIIVLTKHQVQPGPVHSLRVGQVTSERVEIKWSASRAAALRQLLYSFHISSEYDEKPIQARELIGEKRDLSTNITDNIKPFRNYKISVRCIPYFSNGGAQGFWSEPVTVNVRTKQSVPARAPEVTAGGFEPDPHNNRVEVYWRPIRDRYKNGILRDIRIRWKSSRSNKEESQTVGYSSTSATLLDISSEANYRVTVEAATEKGYNSSLVLSPIIITAASNRLSIPDKFVVRYNKSADKVFCSWDSVTEASRYTIYWCRGSNQRECSENKQALVWQSFPSSLTSLILPFQDVTRIKDYSFAISAEQETYETNISSGLAFTECSYDATQTLNAPRSVKIAPDSEQKANSLKVVWDFRKCQPGVPYVGEYVFFFKKNGSDEEQYVVSPDETFMVVSDLEAEQVYSVSVQSKSQWQESPRISVGNRRVLRDGLTQPVKIGIGFGVAFVSIFIIIGIISIFCFVQKKFRQIQKGPDILLPDYVGGFEDKPDEEQDSLGLNGQSGHVTFMPKSHDSIDHSLQQPLLNGKDMTGGLGLQSRDSALGQSCSGMEYVQGGGADGLAAHEDEVGAAGDTGRNIGASQEGGAENPHDNHTLPLDHYRTSARSSISAYCKMAPSDTRVQLTELTSPATSETTHPIPQNMSPQSPDSETASPLSHLPSPQTASQQSTADITPQSPHLSTQQPPPATEHPPKEPQHQPPAAIKPVLNSAGYVLQPASLPVQPSCVTTPLEKSLKDSQNEALPESESVSEPQHKESVSVDDSQKENNSPIDCNTDSESVFVAQCEDNEGPDVQHTEPSADSTHTGSGVEEEYPPVCDDALAHNNNNTELIKTVTSTGENRPQCQGYVSEDQLALLQPT